MKVVETAVVTIEQLSTLSRSQLAELDRWAEQQRVLRRAVTITYDGFDRVVLKAYEDVAEGSAVPEGELGFSNLDDWAGAWDRTKEQNRKRWGQP